jgi:uncharacterized coiled-coil DUF342 family protein
MIEGAVMNIEQKNTSLTIALAIEEVNSKRTFGNIGTKERDVLDQANVSLNKLSWRVASSEVREFIVEISEGKEELRVIIRQIDESYNHLSEIKNSIQNVADIVEKFVSVLEKI